MKQMEPKMSLKMNVKIYLKLNLKMNGKMHLKTNLKSKHKNLKIFQTKQKRETNQTRHTNILKIKMRLKKER